MDQTLSLLDPSSAAIRSVDDNALPPAGASTDEEPDSPGRSPRLDLPSAGGSDPLAEGLALLAGVAIALMAVMVPLSAVICDPRIVEPVPSSR